jgi:hydrogenase-4 membrane subunit HyfE
LFLWFAYSSFGLGVKLSLVISKIKLENNQVEALGKEEAFLVQVVFSLVGVMSVFLISFGKRILKIKLNDTQKHTIFGKQFVYASLNFLLIVFSFGFKPNL